jgi:hypothetical protein
MVRVHELTALIRRSPAIEIRGGQIGVVGDWSVDQSGVIFRYGADDADSPAHAAFRELVEILRPHIEPIYPKLH